MYTYFRVEMKNSAGISAPSEILKLNPSQLIPGPPKQFEALGKTENEIRLQWYRPDINPHAAQKKSHKSELDMKAGRPFQQQTSFQL